MDAQISISKNLLIRKFIIFLFLIYLTKYLINAMRIITHLSIFYVRFAEHKSCKKITKRYHSQAFAVR